MAPAHRGWIDWRGHRFGAAVSAAILFAALLTDARWLVALAFVTLGTSAAFGPRYSIYGAIWRRIVEILRLPMVAPEHPYPPRFAQTIGSVVLLCSLAAFGLGVAPAGWTLAALVAGLQTILGVTGFCLGCRLYFVRWWVPRAISAVWSRTGGNPGDLAPAPIDNS